MPHHAQSPIPARHRAVVTVCAFMASAGYACASSEPGTHAVLEITDDARGVFDADAHAGHTGVVAAGVPAQRGAASLPFGTAPDLVVNLRRQIGGIAIADMNGDGLHDLVAVCYSSNSFPPYTDWREMVFFNSPAGLETTPGWVSDNQTHAGDVQVGDVNGDGHNDIVAIRGGGVRSDSVQIYFGTATGPQTSPGYASNVPGRAWGTSGLLIDIDGDGDLDLATTNQGLSPDPFRPVMLFRNDGSGLGVAPDWTAAVPEISNGIAGADLLGSDGLPELIVAKWVNFQSGIYQNNAGTPMPAPYAVVLTDGTDKGAAVGDITGDGVPEVVFGGSPTTVYAFDGLALNPIQQQSPPFSGTQEVRLHDADGDGDLDLAEVHFSDGRAHIYQNNSGVLDITPTWTFDAPEVGTSIDFGDLNGDGRDDLVIGYAGDTCIRVFYAQPTACPADFDGNGTVNVLDVVAFITNWNESGPGSDFNNDGAINVFDVVAYITLWNDGCP